jgi:hypothetical protein
MVVEMHHPSNLDPISTVHKSKEEMNQKLLNKHIQDYRKKNLIMKVQELQ